MNMTTIITQMAVLFLVLALGYVGNKTKILNAQSNKLLSRLVLNIALPCTILSSVIDGAVTASGSQALLFTGYVLVSFALFFLLAWLVPNLLRFPREDYGLIRSLMIFGNVGYMGYPVMQAVYGNGALFYVTLVNIPFNMLAFTVAIIMIAKKKVKLDLKFLLAPTLITQVVAVVIFAAHIVMPKFVVDTAAMVGRMTTPGAMLVIGSTLADIRFRDVFSEFRLYPVILMKLIVIPAATWLILHFFVPDAEMLGILLIEAGMPTATIVTMFSLQYDGNEKLAAKGVFLTTLFSVATIPLLLYFLR